MSRLRKDGKTNRIGYEMQNIDYQKIMTDKRTFTIIDLCHGIEYSDEDFGIEMVSKIITDIKK